MNVGATEEHRKSTSRAAESAMAKVGKESFAVLRDGMRRSKRALLLFRPWPCARAWVGATASAWHAWPLRAAARWP